MQQFIFLQTPLGAMRQAAAWLRPIIALPLLVIIALLTFGLSSPAAHAQNYNENTLYNFQDSDGNISSGLIDVNGILYGTTEYGPYSGNDGYPDPPYDNPEDNGYGTIYSFDPATNTEKVLYSFTGTNGDGAYPVAKLHEVNGILYGTTYSGGTGSDVSNGIYQFGTIFSFDPATNTEKVLYSFGSTSNDGYYPYASLIDVNDILYGTTSGGGTNNDGTIFSFDPATNTETTLYSFSRSNGDGYYPSDALLNVNGILYGTTDNGGASGEGTVFSFDPATNTEKVLYGFGTNGDGDGDIPTGSLLDVNGILYGTTQEGGSGTDRNHYLYGYGTVFSFDPATNTEKVLYSFGTNGAGLGPFGANGDASAPEGSLIEVNGTLYGTSFDGGTGYFIAFAPGGVGYPITCGTVFSIKTDGSNEKVLYSFQGGNDGFAPRGGLTEINDILYGTTQYGGTDNEGTIYSLTPVTLTAPVAHNDTYAPKYQTPYAVSAAKGVLVNDNAGGSNRPTATLVRNVAHGSLTLNWDGSFTYTPSNGFLGTDTFTYQIATPFGTGNTATVSLNVQAMAPVAHTDTYMIKHDTTLVVAAPGVLSDDSPGDTGTITTALVSNPAHGSLTFLSDGSFTYKPNAGFVGSDSFTYNDTNAVGTSNTAPVNITVLATLPKAGNDTYAPQFVTPYAVKAPGVLANDNAGGSSTLAATLVSNVTHGSLTLNSDGSFAYTPADGFLGTDQFQYYATNTVGNSNTATVTLNVHSAAPVAHTDTYTVAYNSVLTVSAPGVLDDDYSGGPGTVTAALVSNPMHGSLTFYSDGSFTYKPNAGYVGSDSFTYNDTNAVGTSNTAPVNLTILPNLPIAANDTYAPKYATAYAVKAPGVLANDNTGGSSSLTATLVSNVSHGSLTFNTDGSFTYTPSAGFVGTDTFTYHAVNAAGTSNTAMVSLVVQAAVPVAHNDAYSVTHNKAYSVSAVKGVLVNDYAGDSGSFTAALVTNVTHGTLTFNSDGSFTYTPANGFTGTDSFTYQAVNAIGISNTATVTLTVQ